jgi:hypothetical protein
VIKSVLLNDLSARVRTASKIVNKQLLYAYKYLQKTDENFSILAKSNYVVDVSD